MDNKMIFWDEMWNQSAPVPNSVDGICCGKWDKEGKCNCKNKNNENTN